MHLTTKTNQTMTHIEQLHLDAIYGSILAGPKAITAAEAAA
jgi:hypothetical protein